MAKEGRTKKEVEKLTLLQLPLLVQEKFYENLDLNSRKKLGTTCRFYKHLIEELDGVSIKYDQSSLQKNYFDKWLMQTPVKSVHFVGGSCAGKKNESKLVFSDIFRFPLEIQSVIFSTKTEARWMFDVISQCSNLSTLSFVWEVEITGDLKYFLLMDTTNEAELKGKSRCAMIDILCHRNIFCTLWFSKLTFLYIDFRNRFLTDLEFMNVICLLKCIRSNVLKRFHFTVAPKSEMSEMEYFQLCWMMGDFLEFHDESIRDVSLCIDVIERDSIERDPIEPNEIQGHGDTLEEKRKSVEEKVKMILALREKYESIGKKSRISYVTLAVPLSFHWDFWHIFIENLSRLCTFRLIGSTNLPILKNCEIVRGSYKTLKRLRLSLDLKNPFDCTGLAEFERLEEFYVFYDPKELIYTGPNQPNVQNVHLLPPGLKALCLGNVVVSTKDLNKALSKQTTLDTFAILNMGSFNPETGANYKTLKKVFHMRHLQSCVVFQIRCKTKTEHKRVVELLDFQLTPHINSSFYKIYVPGLLSPFSLDIVSSECYRRYFWIFRPAGHYHLRFNDDDPHL